MIILVTSLKIIPSYHIDNNAAIMKDKYFEDTVINIIMDGG